MKFVANILAAVCACVALSAPKVSFADERSTLEMAIASSQYFDFFTSSALNYLQGASPSFPQFDPQAARGSQSGMPVGFPPCDQGGSWTLVDDSGQYYVCIAGDNYRYCPSGTSVQYLYDQIMYCTPYYTPDDSFRGMGERENDTLAIEGLKWFQRSQKHAGLKFREALLALNNNDPVRAQSFKAEGCNQYNESNVALGATTFPANLPPLGFVNGALLDDMTAALSATKAVVCP
ncbi:MAG: hypothetical protein RL189_441 [Pseudomonadota bacterium]|jgi:hypothetical protein